MKMCNRTQTAPWGSWPRQETRRGGLEYSRFQLKDTFEFSNKQLLLVCIVCLFLFEAESETAQSGLELAM